MLFDEQSHAWVEYREAARRGYLTGLSGGAAGALVGSIVPVFGTALGWMTGTVVSWMVGGMLESQSGLATAVLIDARPCRP